MSTEVKTRRQEQKPPNWCSQHFAGIGGVVWGAVLFGSCVVWGLCCLGAVCTDMRERAELEAEMPLTSSVVDMAFAPGTLAEMTIKESARQC